MGHCFRAGQEAGRVLLYEIEKGPRRYQEKNPRRHNDGLYGISRHN